MNHNRRSCQFLRASLCWTMLALFSLVATSETWGTPVRVRVIKKIACLPTDADCSSVAPSAYRGMKTGFKNPIQLPGFCYQITITNVSEFTVTVSQVTDDHLDLSGCGFPPTLPPHGSATCYIPAQHETSVTNTVTVIAAKEGSSNFTTNRASAIAKVVPASIDCVTGVTSPDDIDGVANDSHVTLPADGSSHEVHFSVLVTNTGSADLRAVEIDDPVLVARGCRMPARFVLLAGASTNIALCSLELTCDELPLENTVIITGKIRPDSGECGTDVNGDPIMVSSTCTGSVDCGERPAQGSCRVTGGGQVTNISQSACMPSGTPFKITHGGQVGAPHSVATPFTPDSPCIDGNWEHQRHGRAANHQNFHAKSFDSLMCACLPCEENPDSPGQVGSLCNPDDRICGPEPRRAPANKICFSGVGDISIGPGPRASRSAIFRVDIVDRGEPGGSLAGGQISPPDRYRIRIWLLDAAGVDCGRPFKAGSPEGLALRQAVSCVDPLTEDVAPSAGPPDIDDGGDLLKGNHQIHPATGSQCR